MLLKSDKILSGANMASSHAAQMHEIVSEAVNTRRRAGGQSEAIFAVARELRISARRVTAILRGQVGRVWADEYEHAKEWHAAFCARQADKLAHEAEMYRQRAEALKERIK